MKRTILFLLAALWLGASCMLGASGDNASIVLLLHEGKFGHIAMLVSDSTNHFSFYSINGNNVFLSAPYFMGGWYVGNRKFDDIGVGEWTSPRAFLQSDYNADGRSSDSTITCCKYTVAYQIPTTLEQNRTVVQCFTRMSGERYNLLKNNCATACIRSMWTAGIPTDPPPGAEAPRGMPLPTPFQGFLSYVANLTGSYDFPYQAFRRLAMANPNGHLIFYRDE